MTLRYEFGKGISSSIVNLLAGPRMYYSLFGTRGLLLGMCSRLTRQPIEVLIEMRSIRHPVSLRLRTTDVALCRDILLNGHYDCELSRPPRAIVDAGANIGLSSIFYANKYPEAKIIAIEPENSNFQMLQKNCAGYPRIFPLHAALWRENAAVRIRDCGVGHHAFQTWGDEKTEPAPGAHIVCGIDFGESDAGLWYSIHRPPQNGYRRSGTGRFCKFFFLDR